MSWLEVSEDSSLQTLKRGVYCVHVKLFALHSLKPSGLHCKAVVHRKRRG